MIVRNAAAKRSASGILRIAWIVLLVLVMAVVFFFALRQTVGGAVDYTPGPDTLFCGAEQVADKAFVNGGHSFGDGDRQSSERAFEGEYSCHLAPGEGLQYGFTYQLDGARPGEVYEASVWRYRPAGGRDGFLVASAAGEGEFYRSDYKPVATRDGWEKLQLSFPIPVERPVEQLKVYVYAEGKLDIFFDNFQIVRTGKTVDSLSFKPAVLNLQLSPEAYGQLEEKRLEAFRQGLLETGDDDWVKARLFEGNDSQPLKASVRLKGDWLDHLGHNKWSFRVKMRQDDIWNRMRVFSLHTPKARNFLMEWILHQFFEREDILTPRYDFAYLKVNEASRGLYAYEEHFDKILVEHQSRREGPIVKYTEDGFWTGIKRQLQQIDGINHDLDQSVELMETADIRPFAEGKTSKSETLAKQYEMAQSLMYQFKYGLRSVAEVFELDQLARFYAICDVMGAYHGLAWHNLRFYFNPVTSRLEPIGFDGFGSTDSPLQSKLLGHGALNPRAVDDERIDNKLFLDKDFVERYISYVYRFSSRAYIEDFLATIEPALREREQLIQQEFTKYKFDRERFQNMTQRVHLMVLPYQGNSLTAYTQSRGPGRKIIRVANTHHFPVEIIGYGPRSDQLTDSLEQKRLLESFTPRLFRDLMREPGEAGMLLDTFAGGMAWQAYREGSFLDFQELELKNSARYLFFKPLGIDSLFQAPIKNWALPVDEIPAQRVFAAHHKLSSTDFMNVSPGTILFKKGTHRITDPIVIPAGQRVLFEAGTQLDFTKGSYFLSRSPVMMYGTADDVVKIHSSDRSARGFTVLQARDRSELKYTIFENLGTLEIDQWKLTGAVTFYESNVMINHCVFRNNHCEDAVNIIRSEFGFNYSLVTETFSDGLDADFCKGNIANSRFIRTTNDGMDVSGSNILVEKVIADGCGDKGLSVGEDSDVTVFSLEVKNCPIAVAAKDLSVLIINNIKMSNCDQGFTAYQKKPEYGGARIVVNNYTAEDVKRLYNIRSGSALQLKNNVIRE